MSRFRFSLPFPLLLAALAVLRADPAPAPTPVPAAAPAPASFPFPIPWDDDTASAADLASWIQTPLAAKNFVGAKDGHLVLGKARLRLLGVNFVGAAAFPDPEDAGKIAGHLAKSGIGCVRFGTLDRTAPLGLLRAEDGSIDPGRLDRFDRLVAALKERQIHVDLVLHAGRVYSGGPEASAGERRPPADRGLDQFYPPFVEAQRRYASDLLGHVNPYTRTAYAEEPAVALVEANPVSSLLAAWRAGELDDLPAVCAGELREQWNRWLRARYATDEALRAKWNAGLAPDAAEGPEFLGGNPGSGWLVEQTWPASMKAEADPANDPAAPPELQAIRVRVVGAGIDPTHGSLVRYKIPLAAGKTYVFRFRVKSDRPRDLVFLAKHMAGAVAEAVNVPIPVTTEWRSFEVAFTPPAGIGEARFGFTGLGAETGDWFFGGFSLKVAAAKGLGEGEKLGAVEAVPRRLFDGRTAEVRTDWLAFLADTEKGYWSGMARHLRETVKARGVLLAGNGVAPLLQEGFDAVGTSASWKPPRQPHPLRPDEWVVRPVPMAADPEGGPLPALAACRVAGKPFVCTAFDEPFPSPFGAEAFPLLAAYGALQDWDALFVGAWTDPAAAKAGRIAGFDDTASNPAKAAFLPAAAALFTRGDVRAGPARTVVASPGTSRLLPAREVLRRALQIQAEGEESGARPAFQSALPGVVSDTGDLRWSADGGRSLVTVDTERSALFAGFGSPEARPQVLSGVAITPQAGWSVVAATVVEGESFAKARRVLVAAAGAAANTGMKWEFGKNQSLAKNWGLPPVLVEGVPAIVSLPAPGRAQAWALNGKGERGPEVPVRIADGKAVLEIGPASKTLWYEVSFGDGP